MAQDGVYDLVVTVDGVKEQKGKIFIALYDSEENFMGKRLGGGSKAVEGSSLTLTFQNMESGVYAISIFHDENDNEKLDANFMGIPNEPYAFSNNAKGMFGPPKFEECKFEIVDNDLVLNISL